jgi:integrase
MSVRKRQWTTRRGEQKEAWVVDYIDQKGERHIQTFARKKGADEFQATVKVDVRQGIHTPHAKSLTVAEAARDWLAYVAAEGRERSTLQSYEAHVSLHINPRLGQEKLARLTTPRVHAFRDDLVAKLSRPLAKKVLTSLKSLLKDAQRRGNVAQNVALAVTIAKDKRDQRKLKVGVDIPTPDEIKRVVHAANGRVRPFLITAVFTGLRSSELRGLRWQDVDLAKGMLHVRQRADRYCQIGKPKTAASHRAVPLGPMVVNTLKEWRLACPRGELDLVFPNTVGKPWDRNDLTAHYVWPVMIRAGVVNARGKAKYPGLHALRHFYASWLINRTKDGGLELPIKTVQQRLGHSSIMMTSDVYGHLFPSTDHGSEMAEAEKLLLA